MRCAGLGLYSIYQVGKMSEEKNGSSGSGGSSSKWVNSFGTWVNSSGSGGSSSNSFGTSTKYPWSKPKPPLVTKKVVFLGKEGVGKSCLSIRLTLNPGSFTIHQESTIGAAFRVATIIHNTGDVKLECWDTAGADRYHDIAKLYYSRADVLHLMYDVTEPLSLGKAIAWFHELQEYNVSAKLERRFNPDCTFTLVGNKCDCQSETSATTLKRAKEFALNNGLPHLLTSAKTLQGVDALRNVSKAHGTAATAVIELLQQPAGWQPQTKEQLQRLLVAYQANNKEIRTKYGPPNEWDVTAITDMSFLFTPLLGNQTERELLWAFNHPIAKWDTSRVTSMRRMLAGAKWFNQTIANTFGPHRWSFVLSQYGIEPGDNGSTPRMVRSLPCFLLRIVSAFAFGEYVGGWDTSAVVDMSGMFAGARKFNQPVDQLNTGKVASVEDMFLDAESMKSAIPSFALECQGSLRLG